VKLIRNRASGDPEHGHRADGHHDVLLTKAGREVLIRAYEHRMMHLHQDALPGLSGSLRRHLYRQAHLIAAYIEDSETTWTGLSWHLLT
jgi:CRISPR-associated protein Cas1